MTPSPLAPSRTSPPHPLKPKLSSQEQSRSMGSCPRDCRRLCPRVVGMQRCRTGRGGGAGGGGRGPARMQVQVKASLSLVPPWSPGTSVTPRAFPSGARELGWSAGHAGGWKRASLWLSVQGPGCDCSRQPSRWSPVVYWGKPSRDTEAGCRLRSVPLAATRELWAPRCLLGAKLPEGWSCCFCLAPLEGRDTVLVRAPVANSSGYGSSAHTLAYIRG